MKQNDKRKRPSSAPSESDTLADLVTDFLHCVVQFSPSDRPQGERAALIAFSNGMNLMATQPEAGIDLLTRIEASGFAPDQEAVVSAFDDFNLTGDWMDESKARLANLPGNPMSGPRPVHQSILTATAAGLIVARELPDVGGQIKAALESLNSEYQYLATRFCAWSKTAWQPEDHPFIEYAALFYPPGSEERNTVCRAIREVLPIAVTLSDPWSVALWSETGWYAGRKISVTSTVGRALIAETSRDTLLEYLTLYRDSIIATIAPTGEVRLRDATLRYFADTQCDVFARSYCRGDQPRFVAWSAYDYAFWMGLLSTQHIPTRH